MFWGLVIPGRSIKYREILRFLPFKLPETSTEENCINEIVETVNNILEAKTNESDIDNHLNRIKTLLFSLYDLNPLEIEQINRFLIDFCSSCPAEIKSKN
jgi:hypothetical protein